MAEEVEAAAADVVVVVAAADQAAQNQKAVGQRNPRNLKSRLAEFLVEVHPTPPLLKKQKPPRSLVSSAGRSAI